MTRTRSTIAIAALAGGIAVLASGIAATPAQARAAHAYDLEVSNESGRPVTPGNSRTGIQIGLGVTNNGTKTVRGRLTFAVGSGWRVKPAPGYDSISCSVTKSAKPVATCTNSRPVPLHTVQYEAINLYPPASAPVGVVRALKVKVTTIGHTDEVPSNNSATVQVINRGIADLRLAVKTSAATVARGKKIKVTVTLTNKGPNTATDLTVFVHPDGTYSKRRFLLQQPKGPGTFGEGSAGDDHPIEEAWELGTLKSGRTVVATFVLKGYSAGIGHVIAASNESAGDPGATKFQRGQFEYTKVSTKAVRVT